MLRRMQVSSSNLAYRLIFKTMRYLIACVLGMSAIVQGVLRGKSFARRDIQQTSITTPSLMPVNAPEGYSGLEYNAALGTFTVSAGAETKYADGDYIGGGLATAEQEANYGMANTLFQPPVVSYAAALGAYTPPTFQVTPCSSANNYAADGCTPGSKLYNLNLEIKGAI